ncbi:MAG: protein-S-isoprenylcysteine methyltransferase [Sphingomonadales bacterium]|nr:protein-S-isoprenylcysteine methyltransferase [Sphingomonadales bacterium]
MSTESVSAAPEVPPRPKSAVSGWVGLAGLIGLVTWTSIAIHYGLSGPGWALINVLCCGIPMVLWSVLVDKVHRNPSTGIDWDSPAKPVREIIDISLTKLAGLWATWALIAGLYCIFRWYWRGAYLFAMEFYSMAAVPVFLLSIVYIIWLDRRLIEPRDGTWHFGALLMGQDGYRTDAILSHLRSWAVKGFFTAFMLSIVPGGYAQFVTTDFSALAGDPIKLGHWLITLMFLIDVAMATVGYMLTMRPLDSHIRSANPYMQGWVAALMCYPPFILMGAGSPLDYHQGTADWTYWLEGHPVALTAMAIVLALLTGIYAWATVAFGLRFSNLTDRGTLTHGPYAWTKHPAYVSKNLFWWLETLPFLVVTANPVDAIRNSVILAMVSAVYFWRAKTEERHMSNDPAYVAYSAWMAQFSPMARFLRGMKGLFPARHKGIPARLA